MFATAPYFAIYIHVCMSHDRDTAAPPLYFFIFPLQIYHIAEGRYQRPRPRLSVTWSWSREGQPRDLEITLDNGVREQDECGAVLIRCPGTSRGMRVRGGWVWRLSIEPLYQ